LDVPLAGVFDYRAPAGARVGQRLIVSFGRREMVGIVIETPATPAVAVEQVKDVVQMLDDLPPFPDDWLKLAAFAADYYQRPMGEVMLPALPGPLRKPAAYQGLRAAGGPVARLDAKAARAAKPKRTRRKKSQTEGEEQALTFEENVVIPENPESTPSAPPISLPTLNASQQEAVNALSGLSGFKPVLLHGVTGSGKTEVYLRVAERVLREGRQVMLLVPEINLTPQLEQVFRRRLEAIAGPAEWPCCIAGWPTANGWRPGCGPCVDRPGCCWGRGCRCSRRCPIWA